MARLVEGAARLVTKVPRYVWAIALILLLALVLVWVGYEVGRLDHSRKTSEKLSDTISQAASSANGPTQSGANGAPSDTPIMVKREPNSFAPLAACLFCAMLASFLLAGLISINQTPAWGRWEVFVTGSAISILSLALVFGSWQLSAAEPNKGLFLVAANFLAMCLLVLALCYVPKFVRAMRKVDSLFLRITTLLCVAGAAGGLGYHLVKHDGGLIIPELTKFEEIVAIPAAKSAGPVRESASPAPSPGPSTKSVFHPSFQIGFLGDLFLGLIAANALHLAMSNLFNYAETNGEARRKQYFTILALGILGGYAGATALTSLSNKVLNPAEVAALVKNEVIQQSAVTTTTATASIGEAGVVSQKVTDSMTYLQWPDEMTLAQMAKFLEAVTSSNKPLDKLSADELLAAAGSDFFTKQPGSSTADQYLSPLISQTATPPTQLWAARMLRMVLRTSNGKKGWYDDVQADLASLRNSSSIGDQNRARVVLGGFAQFAAVIDKSALNLELTTLDGGLAWAAQSTSKPLKEAAILAKALAAHLRGTVPRASDLPDDPVFLLRLATAMRAVPKEFLEAVSAFDKKKFGPVLQPFIEKAPSFKPPAASSQGLMNQLPISEPTVPPAVSVSPTPTSTPSSTPVATATPTATPPQEAPSLSPQPQVESKLESTSSPNPL
jgi:hypothetical protein